ncbi:MAG: FAD-binding oxidoreductase [Pseudomonadota bacterium]
MSANLNEAVESGLIQALHGVLDEADVLTDAHSLTLYAQDVYTKTMPAGVVVRPRSVAQLSAAVKHATDAGMAVVPRGGGMSYTSGYVPREAGSVIVDMQGMSAVREINTTDMYVTVECGCTWKTLHEALDGSGYRTPYWGTLSGIHATVGGGLSQNSIFWGSGKHGTASDSVVGMQVVLADGSVVTTGTQTHTNATPFARHFGPDLTGLFCGDTGALGFKAVATLRLIPECEHRDGVSYDFADHASMIAAMSEISRQNLADECFGFDPGLTAVRMQRESLMNDIKKFAGVLKSAGSIVGAIKQGAKVAAAGRGFMKDVTFSLHVMVEERTENAMNVAINAIRAICADNAGTEIENSIPKILRANPFTPLNNMVGPNGERWLPVHTVVPHSKALETVNDAYGVFEKHQAAIDEHGIGTGFLLATVSTNQFVIEPVFFTPDALTEIHETYVEDHVLAKLPGFAPNADAASVTATLRSEIIDAFYDAGGVHMQIGKSYPYRKSLRTDAWALVQAIKNHLDPACRVNPGSLGFEKDHGAN